MEQEKRRKERERRAREAQLREAAFDGEVDDVRNILAKFEVRLHDRRGIQLSKGHERCVYATRPHFSNGCAANVGEIITTMSPSQIDVDAADANGDTALLEAAAGGDVSTARALVERGANVNARGRFNRTPIYRAAFAGVQWGLHLGASCRNPGIVLRQMHLRCRATQSATKSAHARASPSYSFIFSVPPPTRPRPSGHGHILVGGWR